MNNEIWNIINSKQAISFDKSKAKLSLKANENIQYIAFREPAACKLLCSS